MNINISLSDFKKRHINKSTLTLIIATICITIIFLGIPSMSIFWFKVGAGNAFLNFLDQGFDRSPEIISQANNKGYIYSALMVISMNVSLIIYTLIAYFYLSNVN